MAHYKAATPKDISAFSRCIRDGLNDQVESIIWNNPKILVTEVDTPILLHEGCRYNALHIAARNGNSQATKIILKAVGSKKFMDLLYPDDKDSENKNRRSVYLTDLYLNAPDAILHETPLHFACKFGFPDVCETLILHPQTNLYPLNKDGDSPQSMVGSRVKDDKKKGSIIKEINRLFVATCIVPIWRYSDGSHGIIGEITQIKDVPLSSWIPKPPQETFESHITKSKVQNYDNYCQKISAYAGPMTETEAKTFLNHMQKSTNRKLVPANPELSPISQISQGFSRLTLNDSDVENHEEEGGKNINGGDEFQINKNQNNKTKGQLFLAKSRIGDTLQNNAINSVKFKNQRKRLTMPSSLDILKGHAKLTDQRFQPSFETMRDSVMRLEDPLKGLERVAFVRTKELGYKWHEYWRFLDKYIEMSPTGLAEIENHLSKMERIVEFVLAEDKMNDDDANFVETLKEPVVDSQENNDDTQTTSSTTVFSDNYNIEVFQDCETLDVFVHGDALTTDDWFLQKAIKEILESIPEEDRNKTFPSLSRWYDKLKSFGHIYRKGWAAAKPNKRISL